MEKTRFISLYNGQQEFTKADVRELDSDMFETGQFAKKKNIIVLTDADMQELEENKPVSVKKMGVATPSEVKQLVAENELKDQELETALKELAKFKKAAAAAKKEENTNTK